MKKVFLWGSGNDFRIIMDNADWESDVEIVGIVESEPQKDEIVYKEKNYKIYKLTDIKELEYDAIILANTYWEEVIDTVVAEGIGLDKLIIPYQCEAEKNRLKIIKSAKIYIKNIGEIINKLNKVHGYIKCVILGSGRYLEFLLSIAIWNDKYMLGGVINTEDFSSYEKDYIKREIRIQEAYKIKNENIIIPLYDINDLKIYEFTHVILCQQNVSKLKYLVNKIEKSGIEIVNPFLAGGNYKKIYPIIQMQKIWINAENVIETLIVFQKNQLFIQPMSYDIYEPSLMHDEIKGIRKRGLGNSDDYTRVRTLELLTAEIKEKNIEGSMAEVGVFCGGFSKFMKYCLPEKDIYLFDTFEGFDKRDYVDEVKEGYFSEKWIDVFKNTNLEAVKEYLGDTEKEHYRVGYFPETLKEEDYEQKFCLVSLDADMYNPTLAGLEFFYPRLAKGGYIMIHEYNAIILDGKPIIQRLSGVKDAIREFERRHGHISYVPITDRNGSVIITR